MKRLSRTYSNLLLLACGAAEVPPSYIHAS